MLIAPPLLAQEAAIPEAAPAAEGERPEVAPRGDILVLGTRYVGQVESEQPPIATLDEADIASYGANSLTDLLAALAPQTGSGRGRGGGHPVILMNGQRIGNFREMRDFNPEAVRRVEILPEEVALRYGYAANSRVINFILKENFSSWTLDGEYNVPTRGGFAASEGKISLLKINGPRRLNLNLYVEDTTMLTEADRGIVQPAGLAPKVAGDPDQSTFRSLIGESRDIGINGSWSTGLGEKGLGGSWSINASYARNDGNTLSGLDSVVLVAPGGASALRSLAGPLDRTSFINRWEGGTTLNKVLGSWQFTGTVDASYIESQVIVDRRRDLSELAAAAASGALAITGPLPPVSLAGTDLSTSKDLSFTSLLTLSGTPFRVPAGDASMTVKGGYVFSRSDNRDTRTTTGNLRLTRGDLSAGISLALPITSQSDHVLGGLGDISLNFSAGLNHLSDFGTLTDWSAGINWAPTGKLNFQASYLVNEAAPSLQQLGNPPAPSFNVTVYDFKRGESVLVTALYGGNPNLVREQQRDLKISANWQLPFLSGSNLIAEFFRNRSSNVSTGFPLLTAPIEAAFPGRATRDAAGRLIAIDFRPVTFARTNSSRLRYGVNLSGSIGKATGGGGPGGPMAGRRGPGGPPGGIGRGGGMGPMMGMMGGGTGQGRWNVSAYHTLRFSDRVLVAPGGPLLDLLGGDAVSGGGVARHSLELEGGAFRKGFGLRFNGRWNAPTRLKASGAPGTSDLRFGSTFRLDIRLFSNLGMQKRLTDMSPFFKGATLAFQFDNIFDSRQKVTDANEVTPFSYLPDFIDPRGRMVGIDFRKTF